MTNLQKTGLIIFLFLLNVSCGGALNSHFLQDAGVLGGNFNLADAGEDADIELDGEDLEVGGDLEFHGAEQANDEGDLIGEDAALIGSGNMAPEAMPVTFSKLDEGTLPSEGCDAETEGSLYASSDAYANLEEPAVDEDVASLWLQHAFRSAMAEIEKLYTTLGQILLSDTNLAVLQDEDTQVFQCQVVIDVASGGEEKTYSWKLLDHNDVMEFLLALQDDLEDVEEDDGKVMDRVLPQLQDHHRLNLIQKKNTIF